MMGIGSGMGIPPAVTAGMVISGSFFGDKMSPISDTTNLAPAAVGTTLHKHISAMWKTTLPAKFYCVCSHWLILSEWGDQY